MLESFYLLPTIGFIQQNTENNSVLVHIKADNPQEISLKVEAIFQKVLSNFSEELVLTDIHETGGEKILEIGSKNGTFMALQRLNKLNEHGKQEVQKLLCSYVCSPTFKQDAFTKIVFTYKRVKHSFNRIPMLVLKYEMFPNLCLNEDGVVRRISDLIKKTFLDIKVVETNRPSE